MHTECFEKQNSKTGKENLFLENVSLIPPATGVSLVCGWKIHIGLFYG